MRHFLKLVGRTTSVFAWLSGSAIAVRILLPEGDASGIGQLRQQHKRFFFYHDQAIRSKASPTHSYDVTRRRIVHAYAGSRCYRPRFRRKEVRDWQAELPCKGQGLGCTFLLGVISEINISDTTSCLAACSETPSSRATLA